MSFIDDLRTLDTKQPGNWPWPIKAAAFLVIFIAIQVAAYILFWQAQAFITSRRSIGGQGWLLPPPNVAERLQHHLHEPTTKEKLEWESDFLF